MLIVMIPRISISISGYFPYSHDLIFHTSVIMKNFVRRKFSALNYIGLKRS